MAALAQDLRYAFRQLAMGPLFTVVAVVTLALGIGANSAIFSVLNTLLLRPLPYAKPEQLVLISGQKKESPVAGGPLSWTRFEMVRDHSRTLEGVAAFTSESFNLTGRGEPEQVQAARVSWNFFPVLGVHPAR